MTLAHFFELSLDLLTVAGFDGYFKRMSSMWTATLGWTTEEFFASPSLEFVHPDDREATMAARLRLIDGVPLTGLTNRYRCRDGSYRWFEWRSIASSERRLVYAVARDVTERRAREEAEQRVQAQLVSAERMASVGRLAAGVAHQINNPLAFILANLRLALRDLQSLEGVSAASKIDLTEMLSESLEGAERVANIVRGLSSFSGLGRSQRLPVELSSVLQQSICVVDPELRRRAKLLEIYGETPPVEADAARLEEVFRSLLLNAFQAITGPDAATNEVRIVTSTDVSGRAVVEISDTGSGMSPQTLSRIFEPFFTTKSASRSSGLGLWICHTLVTNFDGRITATSEEGRGSAFRVELPAASAE